MSRLLNMLHVAPEGATRNATAQQAEMLHVAPPRACNTQQHPANERSEPSRTIRDLVEFERLLSIVAPAYEIRSVAAGDIAAAISAFRIMAKQIQ
jgi:hypothetical protein